MATMTSAAELYRANTPAGFWRLVGDPSPTDGDWAASIQSAAPILPTGARGADLDTILERTLGEGQFGRDHWDLSFARRAYYRLKPLLPRSLTKGLRRLQRSAAASDSPLGWPVESRYAQFMWGSIGEAMARMNQQSVRFVHFWPQARKF